MINKIRFLISWSLCIYLSYLRLIDWAFIFWVFMVVRGFIISIQHQVSLKEYYEADNSK